jgi:hypothetical protein
MKKLKKIVSDLISAACGVGKRRCSRCGAALPIEASKKCFYCKDCRREYDRERYQQKILRNKQRKQLINESKCTDCEHLGVQRGHSNTRTYHRCKVKKEIVINKDKACKSFEKKNHSYVYNYEI